MSITQSSAATSVRSKIWVGTSLLSRDNARYVFTDAGRRSHEEIYKTITLIGTATQALMDTDNHRRLRIWCIHGFGFLWLSSRLGLFIYQYPETHFDCRPA